ncbi:MAG: hypothetical protein NC343_05625 [Muribaculum sp.]|nr:hypothetical protein [Muribaculaceae bacterium]MCM1081211.1 hypothetical protein [Muribaculum sp.]
MLLWIAIGTVETCVLVFIVAAAVLALAMRPTNISPVETVFAKGTLELEEHSCQPMLNICVLSDFSVMIVRHGMSSSIQTAALAITIKNNTIAIEERITQSATTFSSLCRATFLITSLKPRQRMHVHYNSSAENRHCAFTLLTEPGFSTNCQLQY